MPAEMPLGDSEQGSISPVRSRPRVGGQAVGESKPAEMAASVVTEVTLESSPETGATTGESFRVGRRPDR